MRVKDLTSFSVVHAEALEAQKSYGISERVFQSVANPNDITIQITGPEHAIQRWLESPERAALGNRLEVDSILESWVTTDLLGHVDGE